MTELKGESGFPQQMDVYLWKVSATLLAPQPIENEKEWW